MEFSKEIDKLANPIELKWNGTTHKVFKTLTSLEKWVNLEKEQLTKLHENVIPKFFWMRGLSPLNTSIENASSLLLLLSKLKNSQDLNQQQIQSIIGKIRTHIKEYENSPKSTKLILCEAPEVKKIINLREDVASLRILDLLGFQPHNIDTNLLIYIRAAIPAFAGNISNEADIQEYVDQMRSVSTEWSEAHNAVHKESNATLVQIQNEKGKWEAERTRQTEAWKAQETQHKEDMKFIEENYEKRMALGASESMWETRAREHNKDSKLWFGVLIGTMFCVLLALIAGVDSIFNDIAVSNVFEPSKLAGVLPILLALGAGVSLVVFWILKTIAGEYRRNRALADDAMERTTMVRTFRALDYNKEAIPEERVVIIQALFRPHGYAAEDTMPHPVWESLVNTIKKG